MKYHEYIIIKNYNLHRFYYFFFYFLKNDSVKNYCSAEFYFFYSTTYHLFNSIQVHYLSCSSEGRNVFRMRIRMRMRTPYLKKEIMRTMNRVCDLATNGNSHTVRKIQKYMKKSFDIIH